MRKALRVSVVILVLACSVHAGVMPTGGTANGVIPYGVTANGNMPTDVTANGNMPFGVTADGEMPYGQPGTVTEAALNLLQSVLSLF